VRPSLASVNIVSQFTDNNNGTYQVGFNAVWDGSYSISLVLNNDGNPYGVIPAFTVTQFTCPASTPIQCPNNQTLCVTNSYNCIPNNPCLNNAANPIPCNVNNVATCVSSQTQCDCPAPLIKCSVTGACYNSASDYLCPFFLPLNCAKLNAATPYYCPDGICRVNAAACPAQRVCPYGYSLCPDLTCQTSLSNCNQYTGCSGNQIECMDQSCVTNQVNCPSIVTCPSNPYVCPDGTCVNNDLSCNPPPTCIAPQVLCPSNTCSNSVSNCPKAVSCGNGMALCPNIICKSGC